MKNGTDRIFTDLKDELTAYVQLKWHLWKLMAVERAAVYLAALSHAVIVLIFLFFSFLFFFLALGFVLGEWLGSFALGFVLVSVLYLGLAYFMVLFKKRISLWMINLFIRMLHVDDKDSSDARNKQAVDAAQSIVDGATSDTE